MVEGKAYLGDDLVWDTDGGAPAVDRAWLDYTGDDDGLDDVVQSVNHNSTTTHILRAVSLGGGKVAGLLLNGNATTALLLAIGTISGTPKQVEWDIGNAVTLVAATPTKRCAQIKYHDGSLVVMVRDSGTGSTGFVLHKIAVTGTTPSIAYSLTISTDVTASSSAGMGFGHFSATRLGVYYYDGTNREFDGVTDTGSALVADGTPLAAITNGNNVADTTGSIAANTWPAQFVRISDTEQLICYPYGTGTTWAFRVLVDSGSAVSYASTASTISKGTLDSVSIVPISGVTDAFIFAGSRAGGTTDYIAQRVELNVSTRVATFTIPAFTLEGAPSNGVGYAFSHWGMCATQKTVDGLITFPTLRNIGSVSDTFEWAVQGCAIKDTPKSFTAQGSHYEAFSAQATEANGWMQAQMVEIIDSDDDVLLYFRDVNGYPTSRIMSL
ncbi:MAG: hypothetical protein ACXWZQ_00240 [Candidatus Binatia bacterium]